MHYTKDGKLIHHDGHTWTVKDEIKQYRKDIEEDEKLAERLGMQRDGLLDAVLRMPAKEILDFKMGGAFSVDGTVITRDTFQAIVRLW